MQKRVSILIAVQLSKAFGGLGLRGFGLPSLADGPLEVPYSAGLFLTQLQ